MKIYRLDDGYMYNRLFLNKKDAEKYRGKLQKDTSSIQEIEVLENCPVIRPYIVMDFSGQIGEDSPEISEERSSLNYKDIEYKSLQIFFLDVVEPRVNISVTGSNKKAVQSEFDKLMQKATRMMEASKE